MLIIVLSTTFFLITFLFSPSSLSNGDLPYYFTNIYCLNGKFSLNCPEVPSFINDYKNTTFNDLIFEIKNYSESQLELSRYGGPRDAFVYDYINSLFLSNSFNFDLVRLTLISSILHAIILLFTFKHISKFAKKALVSTYASCLFIPAIFINFGSFIPLSIATFAMFNLFVLIFEKFLILEEAISSKYILFIVSLITIISITRMDQLIYTGMVFFLFLLTIIIINFNGLNLFSKKIKQILLYIIVIFFLGFLTSINNVWRLTYIKSILFLETSNFTLRDKDFQNAINKGEESLPEVVLKQPGYLALDLIPPEWNFSLNFNIFLFTFLIISFLFLLVLPSAKIALANTFKVSIFSICLLILTTFVVGFFAGIRIELRYIAGLMLFLIYLVHYYRNLRLQNNL
jgi:hypothetical protein